MTDDPLAKIDSYTLTQLHKMWAHEEGPLRDAKFFPEPVVRKAISQAVRQLLKYDKADKTIKVDPQDVVKLADRLENKK